MIFSKFSTWAYVAGADREWGPDLAWSVYVGVYDTDARVIELFVR